MNYKGVELQAITSCYKCRQIISNLKDERELLYPDGYTYTVCKSCINKSIP